MPAVGQRCVAEEVRAADRDTESLVALIDDPPTRHAVEVERSFLAELGSGCSLPVGAHAAGGWLHVFLAATDAAPDAGAEGVRAVTDAIALAGDGADHDRARAAARAAHLEVTSGGD